MKDSSIEFARPAEDVAVIKVIGRGSFQNSMDVQNLADKLKKQNPDTRFIIDLEGCKTMDSTFMGTLAGISVEQNKAGEGYLTVVNPNEHTHKLLHNLGLSYILDMVEDEDSLPVKEAHFEKTGAGKKSINKFNQIVHMIQAHKQLIDADSQNEVRFQSVIKYLTDSLEREKEKRKQGGDKSEEE